MTENGNFGIMLRLSPEKLVKTLWLNLILASFSSLELVCAAAMAEYGDKSYGVGRNKMDQHIFFSRILVDENYKNELVFYSTEKF